MFCINVPFFISIISFFISFISFDNTQKTIYRTVKKKLFHSPQFTGRFRRAVVIITGLVCATIVCQVDNEGVFMFVDPREPKDCSLLFSSICTIGNTRKIAKYNELFRRKLFRL